MKNARNTIPGRAEHPHAAEPGHADPLGRVLAGQPVQVVRLVLWGDVAPDGEKAGDGRHQDARASRP